MATTDHEITDRQGVRKRVRVTHDKYEGYLPLVEEICKFFKTGEAPISPRETIEMFAFMEGADESKRQGGRPVSIADLIEKARQVHAQK